jgi:uncharacterized protein YdgA (DUF945 family)
VSHAAISGKQILVPEVFRLAVGGRVVNKLEHGPLSSRTLVGHAAVQQPVTEKEKRKKVRGRVVNKLEHGPLSSRTLVGHAAVQQLVDV